MEGKKTMSKELAKAYEPQEVEGRIYDFWMQGGYFHAEVDPEKQPYTIVIPPPNITGQLHMGHAWDETLQDILIRWKRMQGYSALWLPGTDHASIATEAKIVEAMREEGVTKEDLGREGFLERAWAWKDKFGGRILEQLKLLGSSCDWDRCVLPWTRGCSKAVRHVFVKLYNEGLIYRGERIINWCPNCKTAISDAEVIFEEQQGSFWHIRYPLADGSGYIQLATTRLRPCWGHRRGGPPRGRAVQGPGGQERDPAPGEQGDPHRGRRVRGDGLRHRRGEDHPRPRPQRL